MKTGIVFEINKNKAIILTNNGTFIKTNAKQTWKKGDIVSFRNKLQIPTAFYIAACFLLLLTGLHGLYSSRNANNSDDSVSALISIDINPSLELSVGGNGSIVFVTAYNNEAVELISNLELFGMYYLDAVDVIIQSDVIKPYLESNRYLDFAVYSKTGDNDIYDYIISEISLLSDKFPSVQIFCNTVDSAIAENAHSYNMSIGRYSAFLELQDIAPEVEVSDYSHCSIGEIRNEIELRCHQNYGGNGSNGNNSNNNSVNSSSTHSSGHGHRHDR